MQVVTDLKQRQLAMRVLQQVSMTVVMHAESMAAMQQLNQEGKAAGKRAADTVSHWGQTLDTSNKCTAAVLTGVQSEIQVAPRLPVRWATAASAFHG